VNKREYLKEALKEISEKADYMKAFRHVQGRLEKGREDVKFWKQFKGGYPERSRLERKRELLGRKHHLQKAKETKSPVMRVVHKTIAKRVFNPDASYLK